MFPNLGQSTAELSLSPQSPGADLIDHLNQTIRPDKPLTADDIHIRALLVTSTAVNAYGGRFSANDLPHLCDLLVDSPVLVGHRKDSLPIARVFHTDIVKRHDAPWVRAWFYWCKSADGASTLRDNIDSAVYKECSLSFTYQLPECSICGRDIRLCRHEPFTTYPAPAGRQTCHFIYRQIDRVLETSLVYRGAVENTKVGNCGLLDPVKPFDFTSRPVLVDLDDLPVDRPYLITPAYDGIPVSLSLTAGSLSLRSLSTDTLPDSLAAQFDPRDLSGLHENFGLLVGYHGKERQSLDNLRKYLLDASRPVTRLVVHLFPHPAIRLPLPPHTSSLHSICPISYRVAGAKEITAHATHVRSKLGVDLWPFDEFPPLHPGWRYNPSKADARRAPHFTLTRHPVKTLSLLAIDSESGRRRFILHQFDLRGLLRGCRFIADLAGPDQSRIFTTASRLSADCRTDSQIDSTAGSQLNPSFDSRVNSRCDSPRLSGPISKCTFKGDSLTFTAESPMRGRFVIRPVLLDGRSRFLFYRRRE